MGLFFTSGNVERPEISVVGTEERFISQQPVTLLLKEHVLSFSGDDFSIKDTNGLTYFKCKGKYVTIHDRKYLYDIYNNPIITIKENFSLRFKQTLNDPRTNKKIASIKKSSLLSFRSLTVKFFNKATNSKEELVLKGDFISRSCGIYYRNRLIARVCKMLDAKTLFTNKDSYSLEIAPNVDMALMVALAIIFDEFKHDDSE
ncbi:DUF567-domain-containing protein [Anaeromyces robustus]|jgi:uncharacterized protein YxjI|uniref:DUF567-domain-containing protein n=1 Tax=Anaeromyces robustus TaxID=1754192 RepID=A0A1Y1XL39_9FUNG|nr:DUF567-domain-containing protein [Anaeromyces robustus]|eukprot:ORX86186.1 DUF567-domain-containing protein [Anaeromyces robustus]